MIKNGKGGANTQTGIRFEEKIDFVTYLNDNVKGYHCEESLSKKNKKMGYDIFFNGKYIASSYKKYELYAFLEEREINWEKILSKRLLPDDAVYVVKNNTIHILEIKYQKVAGSTDEKLQTCGFKLRQYRKLFAPLNYEVEYIYILNNWFNDPQYKDVLDYILDIGCKYYFNYLPFHKIGLPVPNEK